MEGCPEGALLTLVTVMRLSIVGLVLRTIPLRRISQTRD